MVGVLVVDINTTTSYRIKKILESVNVEITTATTATEAITRIVSPERIIDLVIIDVKLGPEDGYELINHIRELREDLVICIVTAQNTRRSFIKGITVGATDYVLKPFDDDYLRQKLIYHINAIEMSKAIPNTSPKAIDQAIYNAIKRAIREGYELMIGLVVLYHTSTETSTDVNIKDLAIIKSLNRYLSTYLTPEDEFLSYGSNGVVLILPKHRLDQKELILEKFNVAVSDFLISYAIKDTNIILDFINLPNEVNPRENALTVLAKRIEDKIK